MLFKTIKFVLCSICCLYFLSPIAQANTKQLNLVGEYISSATNVDGTGYQFEMVKAIFEPLGYQVNINVYPYKRALKRVESGQADMVVGMIKRHDMSLKFSQAPHEADKILAIYLKKNKTSWQGLDPLKNSNLVMLSSMVENVKKNLEVNDEKIIEVSTSEQALKMINHGRADFIIMTESEYNENYKATAQVYLLSQPIGYLEIHAAFTYSVKGEAFKAIWDERFLSYLKSKEAKAMYESWDGFKNYKTTLEYLAKDNQ